MKKTWRKQDRPINHITTQATATAHGVPYFTLRRRRLVASLPKKEAHVNRQLLTKAEQATLGNPYRLD